MTTVTARPQPHSDWLARLRSIGMGLGARGAVGLGLGRGGARAAAGNGLLNSLIAYWPGDEASGDLLDLHSSKTLTLTGSVGTRSGLVYPTARDLPDNTPNGWTRNDSDLKPGDVDFTWLYWVYPTAYPPPPSGTYHYVMFGISLGGASCGLNPSAAMFWQVMYANGGSLNVIHHPTAVALDTWHCVICDHDAATQTDSMTMDNVTVSQASGFGISHNAGLVQPYFGSHWDNTANWAGGYGPVAFWQRLLTPAEKTALYNGGAGLAYAAFTT